MNIDIMDGEVWARLLEGEKSIPESLSRKIEEAIRIEKREVEKKYGIRLGRTEISCNRCDKPWGSGGHTCRDLFFQKLREQKVSGKEGSKIDGGVNSYPSLYESPSCGL